MRFVLEPVTGPEIEPVDLERMKRELGEFASVSDRDDDIEAKIVAAREWAEDYTGRILVDQQWRLSIDRDGCMPMPPVCNDRVVCAQITSATREIYLRRSPALGIVSVKTVDGDGVETEVDDSTYELREAASKWPRLVPLSGATWTSANLRIVFRAGFVNRTGSPQQNATAIPERFKQAIILHVRSNYDDDKDAMAAAESILRPLRVHTGFA